MTPWNILAFCVVIPYISPYPRVTNLMLGGHILSVASETFLMEEGDRFYRVMYLAAAGKYLRLTRRPL